MPRLRNLRNLKFWTRPPPFPGPHLSLKPIAGCSWRHDREQRLPNTPSRNTLRTVSKQAPFAVRNMTEGIDEILLWNTFQAFEGIDPLKILKHIILH